VANISHKGGTHTKSFRGDVASGPREPFAGNLRSLNSLLRNSTIGVALFDGNLHCRGFNGALRRMLSASPKRHIGKQLHQVFPGGAPKLELAFRRVWSSGNSLSNLEWTAQLSEGADLRRWVVNFYPITDELRQVRLVATTFSEVTKGRCVESKLSGLRDKFHSQLLRQSVVFEDEFSDISTRTFELVTRSIALLKSSLCLRFHTSRAQLGAALVRHALYMSSDPSYESALAPVLTRSHSDMDREPSQDTPNETDPLAGCPSPRERQVLRFLADGKSNKEIGSILDISTRTVECYRARIMLKLDLHSTAALVRYAVRNNIVEA
jgi:DNA-binding CsgD family transcriptional regulator/PAS domain-containing protein